MCNAACIEFAKTYIKEEDVSGKRAIEVGALDINGSLRTTIESYNPAHYVGVDIKKGPGVDEICDAHYLLERFGPSSFDLLICTEMLEHIRSWQTAVKNFKNILTPNGIILITTRSTGFVYHGYPFDFWRFEIPDMQFIFSDFTIEALEKDPLMPGVFLKARKPFQFKDSFFYSDYPLYSILAKTKKVTITNADIFWFKLRYKMTANASKLLPIPVKNLLKKYFFNSAE